MNEPACIVVMMRRPIVSEEHLMGAFWTAVRLLLRHYREGRHSLRVGSRARVGFEAVAARAARYSQPVYAPVRADQRASGLRRPS
ncbi:MAG: hypothetical protein ABSB69_03875 [Solirubrobacteraceae bacterium]